MSQIAFFGEWIAHRRKQRDLTQRELAARTHCALSMIKKIEAGERRPSRELAEGLAAALGLPPERTEQFVACARGLRPVDSLPTLDTAPPPSPHRAQADDSFHVPTPLIGRARELAEIAERLAQPECRLLTLVGMGGVGKTRLALAAADAERERFADGVAVVQLAAVTDAGLVPSVIADHLGVAASGPVRPHLAAYLRDKALLLVLDNCEQLRDGVSAFSDLLAQCPGLKLMVTSRERLNLVGEWVYAVPPLEDAAALRLFEHAAGRLAPRFTPTGQEGAIAAICRSVGALPLAIELAAGWTPIMTAAEIAERLRRDLDFLHGTESNWPERHRSLRAVFDHTWTMLDPEMQQALMGLSVFRGGWDLALGEMIAAAPAAVMRSLAARSLVQVGPDGRFNLHPLVQQYAADQLRTVGQGLEAQARHARAFLALAGELDAKLHTADAIAAFTRLDREQDNLRAGLQWAYETGDLELAREYFDKLSLYWWRRGHWDEGERWARALDARPGEVDGPLLCWALIDAAFFLTLQGHYAEAIPFMTRAEAMAERLADPETTLRVLIVQAQAPLDIDTATALYKRFFATVSQVRAHSKSGLEAMVAAYHDIYGDQLREAGQNEAAAAEYRTSLALWRRMGNVDAIAYPIGNLGRLALHAGRVEEAAGALHDSVAIARAIGNQVAIIDWLPHLGSVLLAQGEVGDAEACFHEALALCEEVGNPVGAARVSAYLGYCQFLNGDRARARGTLQRSLTAFRALADTQPALAVPWRALLPFEFVVCLRTLALLDLADGAPLRALEGLAAALRWQQELSEGPDLGLSQRAQEALGSLRHQLDPVDFAAAWQSGQEIHRLHRFHR